MAKKNATKPVDPTPEPTTPPPAGQDDTAPVEGAVVVTPPADAPAEAPAVVTEVTTEPATSPPPVDAEVAAAVAEAPPEPLPEPSFELDPASLKTVNAVLPAPVEVHGYRKREFRIAIEDAEALNKLWGGLQKLNARLPDGRKIETPDNALSWLLQTYLAAV